MCFCARGPADQAGAVPWQRCGTALPRAARRNKAARCGAWRLLPAAAMHAHAQIAQRARRAVARGGLRYRAGHLGTSQDAGACIYICFYGRQWSLWLRHGRAATSAQYPGSGPSRPPCAGSSTAFGLSSLLQRASQVWVSLLAYRAAAGSQSQQKGIRNYDHHEQTTYFTLSKERLRRKQHQSPEIVGEGDAAVKFAPQYPVNDQRNGELGMRFGEVLVELRLSCHGDRYRRRESRGGRCGGAGRGVKPSSWWRRRAYSGRRVSRRRRHAYWSQRRSDATNTQQYF